MESSLVISAPAGKDKDRDTLASCVTPAQYRTTRLPPACPPFERRVSNEKEGRQARWAVLFVCPLAGAVGHVAAGTRVRVRFVEEDANTVQYHYRGRRIS